VHVRTRQLTKALKRIGELYAIEAEIRGMTAEQRLAERQLKTKPLLKSLESWLREKMKTCRDTQNWRKRSRPEPVAGAGVLCR
jgi:transposase